MNETTRAETISAVKDLYAERIGRIARATRAVELARNHTGYSMFLESAIESLRLAKLQTEKELEAQMKYWEEKK